MARKDLRWIARAGAGMNAMKAWIAGARLPRIALEDQGVLVLFTAAIFLSAALLFSVQPMFAKMVLPALGGSPSVWAVSMCFFQAMLLAGYCYAHALNRYLEGRTALFVHVAVIAVAALALPIALPAAGHDAPSGNAYLWLIGILAAGVGLPFFAVSANAPLLQSWFARSGHPHAADPYFLYGASNTGSLLVLIAYPLLFEPSLGLGQQGTIWAAGFGLLAASIAVCGFAALPGQVPAQPGEFSGARDAETGTRATWRERAGWVALAFIPSALLVAFSTVLTTDIASVPFLWVMPLALFLLTFILVFRDKPVISHEALLDRMPLLAALAIFGTGTASATNWIIAFSAALAAFLVTSLVCHRELYLCRPQASRLTEFYLWMSAGGALGGIFPALIAPQWFSSVSEFPLLVAAGLLARPVTQAALRDGQALRRAAVLLIAGTVALAILAQLISWGVLPGHPKLRLFVIAGLFAAMVALRRCAALELAAVGLMLSTVALLPEGSGASHSVRSFFGVHRIIEQEQGQFRMLMHGTTAHGAQRIRTAGGEPVLTPVPATYYHAAGPMAKSTELVRQDGRTDARFGVVGLGAGSMACHAKSSETWRFYEIDQAVVDLARDERYFGFLGACRPRTDIVIGDARLTLAREAHASFDYLLIDAFSSDSIPAHLLTVEAMRLYFDKLAPGGVLAIHVSNRHLDLKPVVAANAAELDGVTAVFVEDRPANPGSDAAPSQVVLLSRDREVLAPALIWKGARLSEPSDVRAWTDDYSDVLSAFVRQLTR